MATRTQISQASAIDAPRVDHSAGDPARHPGYDTPADLERAIDRAQLTPGAGVADVVAAVDFVASVIRWWRALRWPRRRRPRAL
jgi:hypothetical protein